MYSATKRKVTLSIVLLAGIAVVIALCLTGERKSAVAAIPDPAVPEPTPLKVFGIVNDPGFHVVKTPPPPAERPKVDVVFALDTTGSMSGLIEGAKRKIWSIANQLQSGQPKPEVRIGLVGYRDLGDAYVTKRFGLSEDIEDVYADLMKFSADGGGDTPEHVNRALSEAIYNMQWREGKNVLRLIFLVGDAPPHEGRQGLHSAKLSRVATDMGIVINTVRCGNMAETGLAWKRISNNTGGMYTSIRQDGAMVAISTPHDERLKELNKAMSSTLLPTGTVAHKSAARRRARINSAMGAMAQAESAKFRSKSGKLDSKDLLFQISRGKKLEDMDNEDLPAPVAALPRAEQKLYVAKVARKRAQIKAEIDKLSKERDAYIKTKKRPRSSTSFDDTVVKALKKQGTKAGIKY